MKGIKHKCFFPFISQTYSPLFPCFSVRFFLLYRKQRVKIKKPVFLLYPKQAGIRAKAGFPFISETSDYLKNTLLKFQKQDDIVAATVWQMLK